MQSDPRVVLLTGNQRRHRFVAHRLAETLHLVGVVSEVKFAVEALTAEVPPEDREVIAAHFRERDEAEARLLGEQPEFPPVDLLELPIGAVNDEGTRTWVRERGPDAVVLYGTSIIKPPLLDEYDRRMINIHLGLSPYYRGSGTNFWPLVHGLPECVGATIHLATARVDAGAILAQVRPEAEATDGAHDLGTKVIISAAAALPAVLVAYLGGGIEPQPQDLRRGQLCRRRDFDAEAVREMRRRFEDGMMSAFVAQRGERLARYPIIQPPRAVRGLGP